LAKHLQLDPYYEHLNNTGNRPNQQVNAAGLRSVFTFRRTNHNPLREA
jgi:hypothetical protein